MDGKCNIFAFQDFRIKIDLKDIVHLIVCNDLLVFALQVQVVDWMKGQTCGLCGKADGEVRQEYRTPNGRVTKNAVSQAHSWVLPAESCRDSTGETQSSLQCYFRSNILFQINVSTLRNTLINTFSSAQSAV